jgi:hypothetical protein
MPKRYTFRVVEHNGLLADIISDEVENLELEDDEAAAAYALQISRLRGCRPIRVFSVGPTPQHRTPQFDLKAYR